MTPTPSEAQRDTLIPFAEKASHEPYFLAFALREHRERLGIIEYEQRRHLKVLPRLWLLFQLCRMPAVEQWDEDMAALCERFGCDRERLERALRGGPGE
jgi:hypothetical protein